MRALWSERQNCSRNVSQKVKRIRRLSDLIKGVKVHPLIQIVDCPKTSRVR